MNLLVALMTNSFDTAKAKQLISAQKVEELSSQIELPIYGLFRLIANARNLSTSCQKSDLDLYETDLSESVHYPITVRSVSFILSSLFPKLIQFSDDF